MIGLFSKLIEIGGLPLLFLLVLLEGNPIIGSFIPGGAIVIFMGFLLATTKFTNEYLLLSLIIIAGYLGDIIGFFMGYKLDIKYLERFGFKKNSLVYRSSSRFFKKFGLWSIILGREFNLTRAFMPFFAGLFKVKFRFFIIIAFISNLIWASLSLYLGYYFGILIINKIEFIMYFLVLLGIYIGILYFIYKNFKNFYMKNYLLYKDYALSNILLVFFSSIFLFILLFLSKFNFETIFNNSFSFLFFENLFFFGFLLSKKFLFFLIWTLFIYLVYKRNLKYILILVWTSFVSILLVLISFFIIKFWFGFKLYISIIVFSQIIFYVYLFFKVFIKNKVSKTLINFILSLFLILIFLIKFSMTQNLFLILISFFISVINSEIIVLLSHYNILDGSISKEINT